MLHSRANSTPPSAARLSLFVDLPRVFRRIQALIHFVIPNHARNADSVVREYPLSRRRLNSAMRFQVSPACHGLFVAPERQGKNLPRLRQAFKTLDGNESIDLREAGLQQSGRIQISRLLTGQWQGFEDHRNHRAAPSSGGSSKVPSTTSTKVRSSRRINRFSCAMAKFSNPSSSSLIRER